ncbi:MAG: hypothetical protein OS112_05715 [Methanoregula sp.]|nr:MAG: hypothetical protein OS112_05715 [Methanoregula sp.]
MKIHFFVLPVIFLLIVSGCISPSSISPPTPPLTPPPTPSVKTYHINEPAMDENLQLTVLKSWDGDRTEGNNKEFYVQLKVQNLQIDKKIQILEEDFLIIDNTGQQYPVKGKSFDFGLYYKPGCDLDPMQSKTPTIYVNIPQTSQGSKVRFNFGGPSGKGSNGPFVYFNVNPNLNPTLTLIPPTPTAPPISYIRIKGASCIPETVNIKVGTMVEWRNEDTFWYTIASESGNAPTTIGQLPAGQTLSYTFSKLGRTVISFYDPQSQNRKVCYIIVT